MIPRRYQAACVAALLALCAGLFWVPQPLRAQNAEGTILGHVQDPTGATVPGARVTIKNINTNVTNTFTTSSSGDYVVPDLIPGSYLIRVRAKGFRTATSTVSLSVDQTLRQNFTLKVGSEMQTVTVSARGQMLQSDSDTIGTVLHSKLVQSLPLNGRDVTNLLQTVAGATTMPGGTQASGFVLHGLNPDFSEVSVNGATPDSVVYSVDGIVDNDQFFAGASNVPGEYAVRQMKVQNGLYGAQYGQGSAQINIAIKSGTNRIHGNAYDFIQNAAFQPNNQVTQTLNNLNGTHFPLKTKFVQNQFGFDVGGPVVLPFIYNGHNKTFWFFDWDAGRRATSSGVQDIQVPTAAERNGNFSDWPYPIYNPATTGSVAATANDPTGRTTFAGNIIPKSEINPIAAKILDYYPSPNVNCTMPCENYTAEVPIHLTSNTETFRVDQNFGVRNRLYFTGIVEGITSPQPNILPATGSDSFTHSRLFGLNWEHTFGAETFNEARVGYDREFFHEGSVTDYGPNLSAQLGLKNVPDNPALFGLPVVSLAGGYQGIGNGNNGYQQKNNIFEYDDNLTMIRGRHTITVGTDIRHLQLQDIDGFTAEGSLNFTGSYTAANPLNSGKAGPYFGNAVADLLLGDPLSASNPLPLGSDLVNVRGTNWNFFAQDNFQVNPRLTVIAGLRYTLPPNYHSTSLSGFVINLQKPGAVVQWANPKFVNKYINFPGANPNFLQCCAPSTLVPRDKLDFAPRIGIAFRPLANNDNLVLRMGYGIFYDSYERFYDIVNFDSDSLYTLGPAPLPTATGFENVSPVAINGLWLPPLASGAVFTTPAYQFGLETEWYDNHNPYNQQWNFDVQYAFNRNLMLDVGYVGLHGLREPNQYFFNTGTPPPVAGDPCNFLLDASQATGSNASCLADPNFVPVDQRLPFRNIGSGSYANANILWSHYNGLQATLTQRFSHGLTFNLAYTWSKALDEQPAINNVIGINPFIQNPYNIAADYGPASYSQTNRFVGSYVYQLPIGHGRRWSLGHFNWVLGGWQTSGIYTIASGYPFTVYAYGGGQDQFGTAFASRIRPNLVGQQQIIGNALDWFNTSAYSAPPEGRYGNLGTGTLTGPYLEDFDFAIQKNFHIYEQQQLAYRLEIFNLGSTWHSSYGFGSRMPNNDLANSPVGCTPGPSGSCAFGSLVPLNGVGAGNLYNPRVLQMSLIYSF